MPETLAGTMLAVLVVGAVTAVCLYLLDRWGAGPVPDPLAGVWRRVRARRPDRGTVRGLGPRAVVDALADRCDRLLDSLPRLPVRRLEPAWEPSPMLLASDGEQRRGLFRRRRPDEEAAGGQPVVQEAAGAEASADQVVPATEGSPAATRRPRKPRPDLDHVPFLTPAEREADDGQTRLRDRLRLGLRKTRDYLNRDVREVFGKGPIPEAFDDLEEILVRADVGVVTAAALTDELRDRAEGLNSDTLPGALREALKSSLSQADRRLRVNREGLSVWLLVGVNGTGKTTSVAKLAAHAARQGFATCLAAGDTFRAAAVEQLETWGQRLGIDVVRQHAGADPAAVCFDAIEHAQARGYDLLIADTAGRLHTRTPLMEELRKVRRVIERQPGLLTETLLVLDATTGQNGISQARAFKEAVEVTGLVLAKLDGTAKGGIVLAVERELGIPVKVVGLGEGAEDVAPFEPEAFVDALFDPDGVKA